VEVHYVEGNHITILDNDKVAAAINGQPLQDPKAFKKLLSDDQSFESSEEQERTRL